MSQRLQRLLVAGAVTAGLGSFGFAAAGIAGTDARMQAAETELRLASLEARTGHDCPYESDDLRRPEL